MRSTNSIKNAMAAMATNIITMLIGFVSQAVFIKALGTEYLGINGLFTNILSMLGIVELGLGSAIIYSLYKPIAEDNEEEIRSLMLFYKNSYRIVAVIIAMIGLCMIPFLNTIVGTIHIKESIVLIYLLFLVDIVASYLLTYKRSILYANQKTYITNIVHIGYLIVMNTLQIFVLIATQNFMIYLIIKIICRVLENIVITLIANKMYPYITKKNVKKISRDMNNSIMIKVKGLVYHKIGSFLVLGTDNIIISKFLGVVTVGLYSNYNLIIQAVSNLFSQVFSSITAAVGNLLIQSDTSKTYQIYKNMLMLNSWIFTFATSAILCLIEPFIKLWIGQEYELSYFVLIILMVNFYIQGMRRTCNTFKEAAGIFHEDRFMPIIESVVNIIASIGLLKIFGLAGVFMGTAVSSLVLFLYSYPKYIYKPLFKRSYVQYIKEYLYYAMIALITIIITAFVTTHISMQSVFLQLCINLLCVIIIPNVIQLIIFHRTPEFHYYKEVVANIIDKKKKTGRKTH